MTETTTRLPGYEPMDPKQKFSLDELAKSSELIRMLLESSNAISQDPTNIDAYGQLGNILHENENFYLGLENPGIPAKKESKDAIEKGTKNLEAYVSNNSNDAFGSLGIEEKIALMKNTKLTKVKGNEEYNNLVDLMEESQLISKVSESEDPNEKIKYIAKKMGASDGWRQTALNALKGNDKYIERLFSDYVQMNQMAMNKAVSDEEGKLDENLINTYAKIGFDQAMSGDKKDSKYLKTLTAVTTNVAYKKLEEKASKAK